MANGTPGGLVPATMETEPVASDVSVTTKPVLDAGVHGGGPGSSHDGGRGQRPYGRTSGSLRAAESRGVQRHAADGFGDIYGVVPAAADRVGSG